MVHTFGNSIHSLFRTGAHHPHSANGWHGLAPRGNLSFGALRTVSANQPRPISPSAINHNEQPWQKAARKQAKRAESHLGWNDRRIAREKRKAEASQVASIAERWS
jgi:hypothetical protein